MKLVHWLMATGAALLFATSLTAAPSVRDGYQTPTFVVPYAQVKPTIDGTIGDDEWQGALAVNALQTVSHTISPRQTTFYMTWNEDYIYVAMRSPLRPGERLVQALRQTDKDINVVFDDSYEVWFNVDTHSPDGQPVFFQYLGNYAGARYDVMFEPAVGNSRLGWTSGWNPKCRLTPDGRCWEMEMAVPRQSMFKNTPFADGLMVRGLLARDFKRPWEQNSVEGTGIFGASDTWSRFILSKSAPAVHLLGVTDQAAQSFGLRLSAFGTQGGNYRWSFDGDGGVRKEGMFTVAAGKLVSVEPGLNLDTPGDGSYRIRVTSADGKTTLLDWCANRQFGDMKAAAEPVDDTGDQVGLSLSFNPVANYIRVSGDFINYDARKTIDKCRVAVTDSNGKTVKTQDFRMDDLAYVSGVIQLGGIPYGDYTTTLTAFGPDGKTVLTRDSKFTRKNHEKEFPWWNTKVGNAAKVLAPWTPVTYRNGRIGVWGREMQVGPAGLPAQVTTNGQSLLVGPSRLTAVMADGKVTQAGQPKVQTVSQADWRTVIKAASSIGDINVTSLVTVEYDGMYRVDLTLTPRKPVKVKSLKAVLPFANNAVDYVHGSGEGIRYGFDYRFLPKGNTGRIWDSTKVDSQPMLVGSFIPYVWLGTTNGGLCWFADSDRGWVQSNQVPAIEVRRDTKASTDMVLNLIGSETTLDAPRTITFAFQASPVKQMHAGWRMDTWWCGDTFGDYQGVSKRGGSLIWTNIPFTLDTEECKKMVEARHQSGSLGFAKYRANAVPYMENNHIAPGFSPEVNYFGDQWKTSISNSLCFEKTLSDYIIYHLGTWSKETGIDGLYIDNVRPMACDNIDAGRGYRLPDGRIQPTYQIFDTRTYYLRMRAAFEEAGKNPPKIVIHMTDNLIIPWEGAADMMYDGEEHVIYPETGKDFMDMWGLERLRSDYPGQWGTAINFMHEYQGVWDKEAMKKAVRAYTGMIILHDALPSGNAGGSNAELWVGRERFGIEADDVRFIGYWQVNSGLSSRTKDVYLAGWRRPGKLLVAVVNTGEKADATIAVDFKKLGLPAGCKVWDAETEENLSVGANGVLTVPVNRHDYRQIIIEDKS